MSSLSHRIFGLQEDLEISRDAPVASLVTADGRGAVNVVAVRGPDLIQLLDPLFQPVGSKPLVEIAGQSLIYGRWVSSNEDLVLVQTELGSDSEIETIEIQCHGGRIAARSILGDLRAAGVAVVSTFEMRCRQVGRWQAETEQVLSHCTTTRLATIVARVLQLQPVALNDLQSRVQALCEIGQGAVGGQARAKLLTAIDQMLAWTSFARVFSGHRIIVFCGQPNVGKSSLSNRLLGFERSIVHSRAGTTRDVINQRTAIDGWPVEFRDTAGLRSTQDQIETIGIGKAQQQIEQADVAVAVFEADIEWGPVQQQWLDQLDDPLVVFNKSDRLVNSRIPADQRPDGSYVSATEGTGCEDLLERIGQRLALVQPPSEQWFPVSVWQRERLEELCRAASIQNTDQLNE